MQSLGPSVIGTDCLDQAEVDSLLLQADGTANKGKMGANAILGVSMAVARAAADVVGLPLWRYLGGANARVLPTPLMNILNGGQHADNGLEIQEFMVVPAGLPSFPEALRAGAEVFHALKAGLKKKGLTTSVGDEGGFAPRVETNEEAIVLIVKAIEDAGYKPGKDMFIALDVAASEFYDAKTKKYTYDKKPVTSAELGAIYEGLVKKYPLISIEDGFDQDDWDGWKATTVALGSRRQVQPAPSHRLRARRGRDLRGHEALHASLITKTNQQGKQEWRRRR
jgi:enolase